ncbi:hypothetical protein BC936DRAFT_138880, partial [Jimgerdemannia flammicorona]
EILHVLAKHDTKIVFSARDLTAAEKVVAKIKAVTPSAEITYYKLDLSSLPSVKAFADEVKASGVQPNGLILGAGTMATPFCKTVDGFETQFGTNHVAHYLLTRLLIDNFVANAPTRVVVLSSVAHNLLSFLLTRYTCYPNSSRFKGVNFSDPNFTTHPYEKWESYGQSKTANIPFAYELKLYAPKGVEAFSVHSVDPDAASAPHRHGVYKLRVGTIWTRQYGILCRKAPRRRCGRFQHPSLGKGGVYLEDVRVSSPTTAKAKDSKAAERLCSINVKKYL